MHMDFIGNPDGGMSERGAVEQPKVQDVVKPEDATAAPATSEVPANSVDPAASTVAEPEAEADQKSEEAAPEAATDGEKTEAEPEAEGGEEAAA
jgi:hypothetical protein